MRAVMAERPVQRGGGKQVLMVIPSAQVVPVFFENKNPKENLGLAHPKGALLRGFVANPTRGYGKGSVVICPGEDGGVCVKRVTAEDLSRWHKAGGPKGVYAVGWAFWEEPGDLPRVSWQEV